MDTVVQRQESVEDTYSVVSGCKSSKKVSDALDPVPIMTIQYARQDIACGTIDIASSHQSAPGAARVNVSIYLPSIEFNDLTAVLQELDLLPQYEDERCRVHHAKNSITLIDKLASDSITTFIMQSPGDADTATQSTNDAGTEVASKRKADDTATNGASKKQKKEADGQDNSGKRKNRFYLDTAIPPSKELPDIAIGAIELNAFFPRHSRWPGFYVRLYRNGWRVGDITKAQLHARGNLNKANWDALHGALRYQVIVAIRYLYPGHTPSAWLSSNHADSQPYTEPENGNFVDLYNVGATTPAFEPPTSVNLDGQATLAQVVHGVVNWPQGEDRGCLTQTLAWAQGQPGTYMTDHTTGDLAQIMSTLVAQGTITAPKEASSTSTWDQSALARLQANVATPR